MTIQKISVAHIQNISYMADKKEVVIAMHNGDRSYDLSLPIDETGRLVDQLTNAIKLAKEDES